MTSGFALALEQNGKARLQGDRISLGFQHGGAPTFEAVDRDDAFFHSTGRWSIFHDTVLLYDTAYNSSELGTGQFAPAVILKCSQSEQLELQANGTMLVFKRKDR